MYYSIFLANNKLILTECKGCTAMTEKYLSEKLNIPRINFRELNTKEGVSTVKDTLFKKWQKFMLKNGIEVVK